MKRTLSVICLISLLASLAACGESADTPESTDSPETQYTAPEVDYGGKTVTITGYSYSDSWAILRYNIGLEEENGDNINDAIVKRNRAVEQELNVNIEMIPLSKDDRSSPAVLEKYVMAQEDVITYGMQMNCGLSKLLTTDGMLVDLKTIPTLDLTKPWWNQKANDEYTLYGKQLAAVGDACFFNLGAPVVMYFSKDLLEKNQLENPYQLVYDGKWTLDKLAKMAAQGASDVNGDQTMDANDIYGLAAEPDTTYYSLYGFGNRFSDRDASGNIKITLNNERTADVVERMINLIRDESTSLCSQRWLAEYGNAHSGFYAPKLMANELLFYSNQLHVSLTLRTMETDFGIIPMPKYDEAQKDYISIANTWFSDHIVVPVTNGDLELVGHLLDAMGYYGKQYITTAFMDEAIANKGVRDEDSLKMIEMVLDNQVFDVALLFDWGGMRTMISQMGGSFETNFASKWAEISAKVDTELAATVAMLKGE
ncbi:MAG: hypothetical protein E7632_12985 [Ruminococcaceae bacterium]|nr:hypothetical protein [Oscillospiraceae bacterium]